MEISKTPPRSDYVVFVILALAKSVTKFFKKYWMRELYNIAILGWKQVFPFLVTIKHVHDNSDLLNEFKAWKWNKLLFTCASIKQKDFYFKPETNKLSLNVLIN